LLSRTSISLRDPKLVINAFLVRVSKGFQTFFLGTLENASNGINTFIELVLRRSEREPYKVMTGRVEKIATVVGINVEENSWNDNCLLFQQLFEKGQAVIQGFRKRLQVQPDVESGMGVYVDLQPHSFKSTENMISFILKVLLQSQALLLNTTGVQQWDRSELQGMICTTVEERS